MQQPDFSAVEIEVEELNPNLAVLYGMGGNMAVFHGPDGTVLIDSQFAALTDKIAAAIASLGAPPVSILVNTHWHFDHSGGNENFVAAGALVLAHENVRSRMIAGGTTTGIPVPPSPASALPVITYRDGFTLHLNGDAMQVSHMPHGHTDGDCVVRWKDANIVQTADLFVNQVSLPHIDKSSGGSAKGMLAAVDRLIAETDHNTRIVPGHGRVAGRADLIAYRAVLHDVMQEIGKRVGAGATLEQVLDARLADRHNIWAPHFIPPEHFVTAVFDTLNGPA